jgi:small subunit ribosomal protein S21
LFSRVVRWGLTGENFLVKIVLRERETVQEAVRRFRKLVERTGLKRELRRRERYEKPSDVKRKAKARAIRRSKKQSESR